MMRDTPARLDPRLPAIAQAAAIILLASTAAWTPAWTPAWAEDQASPSGDSSRGVRIIEAPTPAPADRPTAPPAESPPAPPAAVPAPAPPSATLAPPEKALKPASPAPTAVAPPVQAPTSNDAVASPATPPAAENSPTAAELEGLSKSVKAENPAELAIEILPGANIAPGSKVSFRITTKKAGYLILVDVDPTGKLNQIYPNPMSLMGRSDRESTNLIRPGRPAQLPNPADALARFEFVAAPPSGTAMVVALLSDRPVQMIDLPDVPSTLLGSASAAELLSKLANELRIPDPKRDGAFLDPHWSFDAKFYAIR